METISEQTNNSITTEDACAEGCEITAQTETPATAKRKPKWWMFALPFFLLIVILSVIFWKPLIMAFAPKPALGIALANTANALSDRYTSCPFRLLPIAKEYFYNGRIDTQLQYQHGKTDVRIDAVVHSDWNSKRILADGVFNFNGQELNANAYLDYTAAAIALDGFRKGEYMGFCYDTLEEDLRSTPLTLLLNDEKMQELCTSADQFRQYFKPQNEQPAAPNQDGKSFLNALIECVIELDVVHSSCNANLSGSEYTCDTVRFNLDQETTVYLLERLFCETQSSETAKFVYLTANTGDGDSDELWRTQLERWEEKLDFLRNADSTSCAVVFYIYDDYVVYADIGISVTEQNVRQQLQLQIDLGPVPGKSDICIDYQTTGTDNDLQVHFTSVSSSTSAYFSETFSLQTVSNGTEAHYMLYTNWDSNTGLLAGQVRIDSREVQEQSDFTMTLLHENDTLTLSADQNSLKYILPYVGIKDVPEDAQYSASLVMAAGEAFLTPEYTNISQWKTLWLLELVYYLGRL